MRFVLLITSFISLSVFSQGRINDKIDSLEASLKKDLQVEDRITTLNQLADILMREDTVKANAYANEAIQLSRENDNVEGEMDALAYFARSYTELGELDTALIILAQIVELDDKAEDKRYIANAYISMGNIYDIAGQYSKSLEAYLKAEEKFYESDYLRGVGMANLGIGNIYHTTERYEESIKRFKKSIRILGEVNDPFTSWPMNNMASSMEMLGWYDSAEIYYKKSLELKEINGDVYGASYTYSDLGEMYVKIGEINKAETYLEKALELKLQVEGMSKETIGQALIRLGEIQLLQGKSVEARSNFELALSNALESKSIETIMQSYDNLSKVYNELGDYKKAYNSLRSFTTLQDSLSRIKSSEELAEMQTKYETKEKDAELKIVNSENQLNKLKVEKAEEASKRLNLMFYGAIIIVLLLVVVIVFAWRNIKERKRNNDLLRFKNQEILEQKEIVEEKSREIVDSINYAKRIQTAILPPMSSFQSHLPQSFVLYKPKDIVAGDFYWMETADDKVFFAAADCTGHGVPGAMVSVICNNALNRSVREYGITDPGEILDKTRSIVLKEFEKSEEDVKDGMDIALCSLSKSGLEYAGAQNPLWIIRANSNEIEEIKADKQPVGKYWDTNSFTSHKVRFNPGDTLYIFSDGYSDQFGGEKGKKFKSSNLKELLLSIKDKSMTEQRDLLEDAFENWRGKLEQIDDVCIIGVRLE